MWKVPRQIVTPDLEEDIKRLLSPEILWLFKLCEDEEKKVRIQRITEMLDFLDHLSDFRNSEQYKQTNEKGREWHDVYR